MTNVGSDRNENFKAGEEDDWYWLWESEEEEEDDEDNNESALSEMFDLDGLTCLISKSNVKRR